MRPSVLDPCCGTRMWHFDRENPLVVFGDCRKETITVTDNSKRNPTGKRVLHIEPDVLMDFRAMPYSDNAFNLVVFDPPHLVTAGPRSWLGAKYGLLNKTDWRDDIRRGFAECFRVLTPHGTLVFKWNETQVALRDVLPLAGRPPVVGQVSGAKGMTHFLVFIKEGI